MSLVVLTFIIGVSNLCLGYAVAMHLGYGPPGWSASWEIAFRHDQQDHGLDEYSASDLMAQLGAASLDDMLDDAPEEDIHLEPVEELYDDDAATLLSPDAPEAWNLDEKYVEASILKLNVAMMKSGSRATEIDTQLRAMRGGADRETIQQCVAKLLEDCKSYLAEQTESAERFSDRISEMGELSDLGEDIEMANMEQSAQIETTISNLEHMDLDADLEAACLRLLEELNNLRVARHQLRDSQETAFLTVARYENRIESIEPQLFDDPLTRLRGRIGLEAALFEWWSQRRHTSRQISAVLFDLNAFGQVNENHGSRAADRIIREFGQLIQQHGGSGDLLGRFAGQQFLMVMIDTGPRAAIKNAETIRQAIESVSFVLDDGKQIKLTTSGAVTEVSPEDGQYTDVLERLEKALSAAKTAGSNHLFSCGRGTLDSEPELIESPNFGIEPVAITIS